MGLDWMPGRKARPGHEDELRRLDASVQRRFCWGRRRKERRIEAIAISAEETLQAPVVGIDAAATAWARERFAQRTDQTLDMDAWMQALNGVRVVDLAPPCDGLARYTNGGLGQYIGRDSFRAQFLRSCTAIVGEALLDACYVEKSPQHCLDFADALERKAMAYAMAHGIDLARVAEADDPDSTEFQLDVVLAAARWCRYWGSAGHGMVPWF